MFFDTTGLIGSAKTLLGIVDTRNALNFLKI